MATSLTEIHRTIAKILAELRSLEDKFSGISLPPQSRHLNLASIVNLIDGLETTVSNLDTTLTSFAAQNTADLAAGGPIATDTQVIRDRMTSGGKTSARWLEDIWSVTNAANTKQDALADIETNTDPTDAKIISSWLKDIADNTDSGGGPSIAALLGAASTGILATINTTNVANGVIQTAMAASLVAIDALLVTIEANTDNIETLITSTNTKLDTLETTLTNIEADVDVINKDCTHMYSALVEIDVTGVAGGTTVIVNFVVPADQVFENIVLGYKAGTGNNQISIEEYDSNANLQTKALATTKNMTAGNWIFEPENDVTNQAEFHGGQWDCGDQTEIRITTTGVATSDEFWISLSARCRDTTPPTINTTGTTATVTKTDRRATIS